MSVEGVGLPPDSHGTENTFLGSTVKLQTINILKKIVDRAIKTETLPTKGPQNDVAVNLKKLSLAFPDNDNIQQATQKYACNKLRNDQLVLHRNISETIEGRNPNGSVFQLQLNAGSISTMTCAREPIPSWKLRPTSREKATVPLSSLADLSIFLGNSPISVPPHSFFARLEHIPGEDFFVMSYSRHFPLEVVFGLDNSIEEFAEDRDLIQRIRYTTLSKHRSVSMLGHNGLEIERLPASVTVRLAFLQVKLDAIRSRLNLLGIRTDDDEKKVV